MGGQLHGSEQELDSFSALVHYINQVNALQSLKIRYFEKGHTFMAADSFHKKVEDAMRQMNKLYDFDDFVDAVNKHGIAVNMKAEDFKLFEKELSKGKDTKYPYLSDVGEVCFREGSTKMFWKEKLTDIDYKQGEFLQKKCRKFIAAKKGVPSHDGPRGLNTQKKNDILLKLGPIIPEDKL